MRQMKVCVLVVLGLIVATAAHAQGSPPGSPEGQQGDRQPPAPLAQPRPRPDFLFGPPKGSVGIRGNWLFARAQSDWFSFVTDELTLDAKDFNAPGFAADVSIALSRRADAVIGLEFSQSSTASEYRDFVDNDRLPINQTTRLRTFDMTGSVKLALLGKGVQVSRLAWVPRQFIPYVGAGGGLLRYDLEQTGDFIDYTDFSVFGSAFRSSGWTPLVQAFGGVDVRVLKRVYVTLDARYQWAKGTLDDTWIDFDPIDLAGFKLAAGASLVF